MSGDSGWIALGTARRGDVGAALDPDFQRRFIGLNI
jgi:hypothetical protein